MDMGLKVIGWIDYALLFGGFIWAIFVLWRVNSKMREIKKASRKVYKETKTGAVIDASSGKMGEAVFKEIDVNAMDEVRERFNAENVKYLSAVQCIPIFPLLGLLGTVLGLIPGLNAMSAGNGLDQLSAALSTALYTTFFGLIFSIVLKLYVSFCPYKTITEIEDIFDENDRKYNNAVNFNKVTAKEK